MKSTCRRAIIGAALVIVSGIAFSGAFAEQTAATAGSSTKGAVQKKGQGEGPLKSVFEEYQSNMKSFMDKKQKEHQDFKTSLKDKSPADQKAAIDQFRTKQAAEIKSFVTQQRSDLKAKVQGSDIPDAKKGEIMKNMQDRWAKVDAHVQEQMKENKQTLDQIYSDNTVSQEEKEMWKEQRKTQLKENKDFRDTVKPGAKKQGAEKQN
jgi:hypothetical protein